jgi:hypothetical protein
MFLSLTVLAVVWSGKFLLTFASKVILGSRPHKTHDHIFVWLWSGKLLLVFISTVVVGYGPNGTQDYILLSYDTDSVVKRPSYDSGLLQHSHSWFQAQSDS